MYFLVGSIGGLCWEGLSVNAGCQIIEISAIDGTRSAAVRWVKVPYRRETELEGLVNQTVLLCGWIED